MKLRKLKSPFWSLFAVALVLALPFPGSAAESHRGGPSGGHAASVSHAPSSFHGGGGFSGGSFRGAPSVAQGPRGGTVVRGPSGGTAFRGPSGGGAVSGPREGYHGRYPGGAYYGGYPGGGYYGGGGGWDAYYGPEYYGGEGGGLAAAIIAALAIGTILEALPSAAAPQAYGGQTYYYDGTNYYQTCYQGTDVAYCVVPNPYGP
jgi:hypothetical protein